MRHASIAALAKLSKHHLPQGKPLSRRGLRVMRARWVASRRLGVRVPPLAHAHPLCGARHSVEAFGTPETDLAEAERSGLPAAAASTRGVGEDLTTLVGSLAADAADAAAAAPATVEASAARCRQPTSRRMFVWLPLALLLAPARAAPPSPPPSPPPPSPPPAPPPLPPCAAGCADVQPSSYALPSKLLELKASGIAGSAGAPILTWSDTSGTSNHASSSGSVSNSYTSPVLVEHTDSQGSVHKVARFGCSNCASASPTWGTVTNLQTSQYVFSTQSAGLEAWAVVRQPDTGVASDDTASLRLLFDFGHLANLGYGLYYAAGRVDGYTPSYHGGIYAGTATTVTHALTIVRMRVVFGSGGVMRFEQNGQLVKSVSINLGGLTATQINSGGPFLIGSRPAPRRRRRPAARAARRPLRRHHPGFQPRPPPQLRDAARQIEPVRRAPSRNKLRRLLSPDVRRLLPVSPPIATTITAAALAA